MPAGCNENTVYMKSLRHGEEGSGEAVHIPAGMRLMIKPGNLLINVDEIDARNPTVRYGCTPVVKIIGLVQDKKHCNQSLLMLLLLLSATKRLDACVLVRH